MQLDAIKSDALKVRTKAYIQRLTTYLPCTRGIPILFGQFFAEGVGRVRKMAEHPERRFFSGVSFPYLGKI